MRCEPESAKCWLADSAYVSNRPGPKHYYKYQYLTLGITTLKFQGVDVTDELHSFDRHVVSSSEAGISAGVP